ncbi:GNAT family N-acetyltransferase [Chryseobacterium sp. Ch-15]|uniref:GNAT family N-acetyltransferase n=1 Tax=Chryseobacterium muglaense TaxID=2893752 RepID=A0A9Q3V0I0_9FLAO|nr:GNAT family N-acetyltransferase [Chryseobacterium muglaense]MBD3903405.1 hypothetical protein [Chryseobacterium muglaense]MCC9036305.1 GNAT family N-acetyltransferase [Chryseobacterium muglaense]MCM2554816.1 GNAT family N-acetyltransferase [Chryseobacterium muglaense]
MIIKPHSITNKQRQEILKLVEENAESISVHVYDKKSPIYNYLKTREVIKIGVYLSRIGSTGIDRTNIVLYTNDSGTVTGFILYHQVVNQTKDVAIICTIVSDKFRRKGILKVMMTELQNDYNSISLSCFLETTTIYSKFGFQIAEQWQTQVGMYYGYFDDGKIVTVDDELLDKTEPVLQALRNFQKNDPNWKQTVIVLNQRNEAESKKVEDFINKNFTK